MVALAARVSRRRFLTQAGVAADVLIPAPSFTDAAGHALLIAGTADGGQPDIVHDPNIFPGRDTDPWSEGRA